MQENDEDSFSGSDDDMMQPTGVPGMFIEECSGWDLSSDMDGQYYDAKLKKSVGPYPAGSVVDDIEFSLYSDDEPMIRIHHNKKIVTVKISTIESDDVWVTTDQVEVTPEEEALP